MRDKRILVNAHEMVNNGYKPGILMIDDRWQKDIGAWDLPRKIP